MQLLERSDDRMKYLFIRRISALGSIQFMIAESDKRSYWCNMCAYWIVANNSIDVKG